MIQKMLSVLSSPPLRTSVGAVGDGTVNDPTATIPLTGATGSPNAPTQVKGTLIGAALGGIAGYMIHGTVTAILGIPIGAIAGHAIIDGAGVPGK